VSTVFSNLFLTLIVSDTLGTAYVNVSICYPATTNTRSTTRCAGTPSRISTLTITAGRQTAKNTAYCVNVKATAVLYYPARVQAWWLSVNRKILLVNTREAMRM
jgi:hypothetical protein